MDQWLVHMNFPRNWRGPMALKVLWKFQSRPALVHRVLFPDLSWDCIWFVHGTGGVGQMSLHHQRSGTRNRGILPVRSEQHFKIPLPMARESRTLLNTRNSPSHSHESSLQCQKRMRRKYHRGQEEAPDLPQKLRSSQNFTGIEGSVFLYQLLVRGLRMGGWIRRGWIWRFWGTPIFSPEAPNTCFKGFWDLWMESRGAPKTPNSTTTDPTPHSRHSEIAKLRKRMLKSADFGWIVYCMCKWELQSTCKHECDRTKAVLMTIVTKAEATGYQPLL